MRQTLAQARSFNLPIRLLFFNQLTINIGFYMLMPYLANHLSGNLGLAAWLVGLILGIRNLSQQGMFLFGGSLADRLGYKPMILTGLLLRTTGFVLLGFVTALPALIVSSALIGLAGAFFNPAARAYLAQEAGERKAEAFAVFNVFYQAGILIGPLIGLVLNGVAFQWGCVVAAGLFLLLTVFQLHALPARRGSQADSEQTMIADWRDALKNRGFLLFSLAMIGSYILNFQVYLGLPIEVQRLTGSQFGVAALFAVSGVIAIFGQVRVTSSAKARWTPAQAVTRGLALMGLSFLPLAVAAPFASLFRLPDNAQPWYLPEHLLAYAFTLGPVLLTTALLTLATLLVYPFEMATIVTLGGERMVGTYYGLYSTLTGIGIAAGNLLTGAALDAGHTTGAPWLPWFALAATGAVCAAAIWRLDRSRLLDRVPAEKQAVAA